LAIGGNEFDGKLVAKATWREVVGLCVTKRRCPTLIDNDLGEGVSTCGEKLFVRDMRVVEYPSKEDDSCGIDILKAYANPGEGQDNGSF
jgi:hypothetical protein